MKKQIQTDKAPGAVGPYSQAIEANGTLYVSGQIGLVPETGKLVSDDAVEQTVQVFKNLNAVLAEAGYTINDAVKCTMLLENIEDFQRVNEEYVKNFAKPYPARAGFAVDKLPAGAKVEIEMICVKN